MKKPLFIISLVAAVMIGLSIGWHFFVRPFVDEDEYWD